MRNIRSRKTAEKMAAYKTAASKNNLRQRSSTAERQGPTRVSPRRKSSADQSKSTALSSDVVKNVGDPGVKRNAEMTLVQKDKPFGFHDDAEIGPSLDNFDDLEEIPETPPRSTPGSGASGRSKRVHAPRPSDIVSESDNDSEKPSKKRRVFTTPPRDVDRGGQDHLHNSANGVVRRSSFRSTGKSINLDGKSESSRLQGHERSNSIPGSPETPQVRKQANVRKHSNFQFQAQSGVQKALHSPCSRDLAERSAYRNNDLGVLSVSCATLSKMMEAYGRKVVAEVKELQKENIIEVRKIADGLLTSVSSEMRHMEGVFSMMTRGMGGVRGTKQGSKTSLTEWEKKLNSLTPGTEVIFNREIFAILLCYNTAVQATMVYRNHGGKDVEKAVLSAQTLFFSLQPGDKKFSYSGRVGALHSEFKFTVIQNSFFNVLRDTFGMFNLQKGAGGSKKENSTNGSMKSVGSASNSGRSAVASKMIKRPSWIDEKVTRDHINEARNFLEQPNQYRKSKVRQTPSPYDIACHGALRVYRLLGSYLHIRRGAVRTTFFQNLGYLLVLWVRHVKDVDQAVLKMSWSEEAEGSLDLNLDDVPHSEQSGFETDHSAVTSVGAKNKTPLEQIFSDYPGMVLAVEHTVHVVNGTGVQRRHSGGEPRTIHRLFNLIYVATDVCVEYCGAGSRENFLRAQKYSLQCIMIFALVFKAFCVELMEQCEVLKSSAAGSSLARKMQFPEPNDVELHGFSLKDLIPGPTTQKNLLECRCLRMTHSEFNVYNHTPQDAESASGADNEDILPMMDIQESEDLGIGVM